MTLEEALKAAADHEYTRIGKAAKVLAVEIHRRDPARADAAEAHQKVYEANVRDLRARLAAANERADELATEKVMLLTHAGQLSVQLRAQVEARDAMASELAAAQANSLDHERLRRLEVAATALLSVRKVFVRWTTIRNHLFPHLRPAR